MFVVEQPTSLWLGARHGLALLDQCLEIALIIVSVEVSCHGSPPSRSGLGLVALRVGRDLEEGSSSAMSLAASDVRPRMRSAVMFS
jgi:hypothetical protein